MASQLNKTTQTPLPCVDEVLADIAYFRRCISEAGPLHCAARRAVQAAYTPFLARRFELLAALTANGDDDPASSDNA